MDSNEVVARKEYATVRLTKAVLDDYKSVAHGEIVFDCGRRFVPAGTQSDLLGLYGQNGSGKTTLIEALSILQHLLSGHKVPDQYSECVAVGADSAHLSFEFDFQYPDGRIVKVGYAFGICAVEKPQEETKPMMMGKSGAPQEQYRVKIFDEVIRMGGELDGKKRRYRTCIDTSEGAGKPFGPESRHGHFFTKQSKTRDELFVKRILASERSQSFIFMDDVLSISNSDGIFNRKSDKSDYLTALWELKLYGSRYLFVIDSVTPALASADIALPLYTPLGMLPFPAKGSQELPNALIKSLSNQLESINEVLCVLIPGLSVHLKELMPTVLKDGSEGAVVMLMSDRDGNEFPMRDESDGVKKIISSLGLLTAAFNQKSITVAIDEFDAGVFEYLLGEILYIMQEYGRGQLIFTSHNLRPLEVLSKEFIWFTTTNPENRYYHMKKVASESNLRDMYFREIMVGEQDEELYSSSKRFRIVAAFRKAAMNNALKA